VHFDNRGAERRVQAECQKQLDDSRKQLEEALEKIKALEAEKAEAAKKPCCPAFKIESVTTVGKEVIVTFDNCTYLKAPMDVVDESLGKAKTNADAAKVDELSKALEELKAKVEEVAAKEDKDTVYDDSALVKRIEALETKEDKDTVFDPSALEARIKALENAPAGDKVDTTEFVRKDELVDVQNWAGTTRFKAYPAYVKTGSSTPTTVYSDDKL
jgi:hypothetical protein